MNSNAVASTVVNGKQGVLVNDTFRNSPGFQEFSQKSKSQGQALIAQPYTGSNTIYNSLVGQGGKISTTQTQKDKTLARPYPYSSAVGYSTNEGTTEILTAPVLPKKTFRQEAKSYLQFATDIYEEDKRRQMSNTDVGGRTVQFLGSAAVEGGTYLEKTGKSIPKNKMGEYTPFYAPGFIENTGMVLRAQGEFARESPRAFVASNIISFGAGGILGKGAGYAESKIASGEVGQLVMKYPRLGKIGLSNVANVKGVKSFSQALSFRKGVAVGGTAFLVTDLGVRGYVGGKESVAREAFPLLVGGAGYARGFRSSGAVSLVSFKSPRSYEFTQLSSPGDDLFSVKGRGRASLKLMAGESVLQTYPKVELSINAKQNVGVGTASRLNPGQTDIRVVSKTSSLFGKSSEVFKGVLFKDQYSADYDLLAVTKGTGKNRVTFESFASQPVVTLKENGVTTKYSFFRNQVYRGSSTPKIVSVIEGVTRQDYFARGRGILDRAYTSEGSGFSAKGSPYLRDTGITLYPGSGVSRGKTGSQEGVFLLYPKVSRGISLLSSRGLYDEGVVVPRARRLADVSKEIQFFPKRVTKLYSGIPEVKFEFSQKPSESFFPRERTFSKEIPRFERVRNFDIAGFPISSPSLSSSRLFVGLSAGVRAQRSKTFVVQNPLALQDTSVTQRTFFSEVQVPTQDSRQFTLPLLTTESVAIPREENFFGFTPFAPPPFLPPKTPVGVGWFGGFDLRGRRNGVTGRKRRGFGPSRTIAEVTFGGGGRYAKAAPGGYTGLEFARSYDPFKKKKARRKKSKRKGGRR